MPNKRFAVTGGIGSGKSAFCRILQERGYPVFSCDEISESLWAESEYRAGLARLFPDCTEHGEPVKELISARVFSDETALKRLNFYAHEKIMARLVALSASEHVSFSEVPLLFEGGYEGIFDAVIAVVRAPEERIRSVALRDGLSRGQILSRMERQFDYGKITEKNCILVENNGSLEELSRSADIVLKQLNLI